jgi:lysozyme
MKTSIKGRLLIEQFEGLYLTAYDDGFGTLTIGYGHTTAAGLPQVTVGQTITKEEADTILSTDLEKVELIVTELVHVELTQSMFDALVSFEFNTGALRGSTLLKYLNEGNIHAAADQFLLWDHAKGRVVEGLLKRREAEKELFLSEVPATIVSTAKPSWFSRLFRKGNK